MLPVKFGSFGIAVSDKKKMLKLVNGQQMGGKTIKGWMPNDENLKADIFLL